MSKKAVWLSDIEFIEMHSSDWERLESGAFEADESVQSQLNPNQQIVLDWLKEDYSKNSYMSPFGTIYGAIRQHESQIRILPQEQQAQVLQAFSQWSLEQEEAE
ncbi:hypothetical protein [Enterococcus faecalis]|uniref:hypothetical protein n=1 Tax=Enterococcus faecalis TaxID=1351 RepID=UPI00403D04D7